jgi:hypothetical protein
MLSLIQHGLATAKWVGHSIRTSVSGFIKPQAPVVTLYCGMCGKQTTSDKLIVCSEPYCLATGREGNGISSTPTTQPLSSTDWALALKHKYGISKPMEDE